MRKDVYFYIKQHLEDDVGACARLMQQNFDNSNYKRFEKQFKLACLALKEFEALVEDLEF